MFRGTIFLFWCTATCSSLFKKKSSLLVLLKKSVSAFVKQSMQTRLCARCLQIVYTNFNFAFSFLFFSFVGMLVRPAIWHIASLSFHLLTRSLFHKLIECFPFFTEALADDEVAKFFTSILEETRKNAAAAQQSAAPAACLFSVNIVL